MNRHAPRPSNARRPRHATVLATALAAALTCSTALAGEVRFQVGYLNTPAGYAISSATDINASGQVVGYLSTDGFDAKAVTWTPTGQMLELPAVHGASGTRALGINDSGQIVGVASGPGGIGFAVLWSGGSSRALPSMSPTSTWDAAVKINNDGLIVGNSRGNDGWAHAALWRQDGTMLDLGPAYHDSRAYAINNWGEAVGYSYPPNGNQRAVHWNGTQGQLFGVDHASAVGINDLGQVIVNTSQASPYDNPLNPRAYLYPSAYGGLPVELLPAGQYGSATDINNAGQVIGNRGTHPMYDSPFIWSQGNGAVDLNTVLKAGSAPTLTAVRAMNDDGQIVGEASHGTAVVLTPTGRLNWTGATGNGAFNEAGNWDSGLGFAPNKFLDVVIAPAATAQHVAGPAHQMQVRSLVVGGGGAEATLLLATGGKIDALQGTRIRNGGRLAVYGGGDALFGIGHLGGDLTLETGGALVFNAEGGLEGAYNRLILDGIAHLEGGDLVVNWNSGLAPQLGMSLDLIDWNGSTGSFAHLILPELAAGLAWDTSNLYATGVLSVGAAAVPEPGTLYTAGLGGMLIVLWRRLSGRRAARRGPLAGRSAVRRQPREEDEHATAWFGA